MRYRNAVDDWIDENIFGPTEGAYHPNMCITKYADDPDLPPMKNGRLLTPIGKFHTLGRMMQLSGVIIFSGSILAMWFHPPHMKEPYFAFWILVLLAGVAAILFGQALTTPATNLAIIVLPAKPKPVAPPMPVFGASTDTHGKGRLGTAEDWG